ncbi:MAG: HAMP domain-containing protein [Actinobacteria bacterium]|uniref:histidine kinase n=1 Tax=freshwater metagenome TaxID=449393 RepID=A0A6J6ITB8_9ZZZZ|nr:HAMP domain-containing protein [Actinomycetota bacterium]
MRIRTKVTLATVGVATISSFAVGAAVLGISYNSGIRQIQNELASAIQFVESSNDDAVTSALLAVGGREFTLVFIESDGTNTMLQDTAGELTDDHVEKKILGLADGEKLVFAASSKSVFDSTINSLLLTMALSSLAAALGILISWFTLRTDLQSLRSLTYDAQRIAAGNLAELATLSGSSEIQKLSLALSQLIEQLQATNLQMQEFLGDASHELRTPLTVIRGYLEMLQASNEITSEQAERAIDRAHKEALRMQAIISDILLLAELGEERELAFAPMNFEEVVGPILSDLRAQNSERRVEVISNQSNPFIGSSELFERFFQNVFSNIRRYTPIDSEVKVHIIQSPVGLDLNIDDAGPGIGGLEAGTNITAFRRFDESRSREGGGSGLGLSIMAKIVEKHGGEMHLSRSSLGGLRVSVFLPC